MDDRVTTGNLKKKALYNCPTDQEDTPKCVMCQRQPSRQVSTCITSAGSPQDVDLRKARLQLQHQVLQETCRSLDQSVMDRRDKDRPVPE